MYLSYTYAASREIVESERSNGASEEESNRVERVKA
jgi:hypothetical protein